MLSPGQDEDAEASRWQEDTKVNVQQTDDLINLAKKQKKSIIFIYNKESTKVTVLQTDDTMDPTMEEAEEGSEPEANSEVTI